MAYGSFISFPNYNYGILIPEKFRPKRQQIIVFNTELGSSTNKIDLSNSTINLYQDGSIKTTYPYNGESNNGV